MKLIRCCKRQGIKTVHEFMKKVAIYNNDGKLHFSRFARKRERRGIGTIM